MSVDVRGLKITIGGKPIVSDADMTIADGERVGLIGSSGSGKSMIAKAMLGLLPLTAVTNGSIDMGGTEIIGASERALADLRGRYVGAVFQNPAASLNPVMTVAQQIALPLRLHYDLTKAERADRYGRQIPARTVRRPTAARGHRHGADHLTAIHHRGRTHHRTRLHHATPDRGPADLVGGRRRRIHAVHHP